jgi:acetyl esterase
MSDLFIRPDVRRFLDTLKLHPRPALTAENIAFLRPLAPQGMAMLEPPIGELGLIRDTVMPGPGGEIPLRFFDARAERAAGPAVVFFHGGGFVIGNIDTHASMCAEIARRLDLPVISVDYRLAPEHPWPAAPDDAEAATRWIAANCAIFGRAITHLVLCGDSAGGTLAIVTALALRDIPACVPIIALIAFYPGTDLTGRYVSSDLFGNGFGLDTSDLDFYNDAFAPPAGHWRASPLLVDQTGMPATLIATAALDPLRDQGRAFAAKLIASGVSTTYREFSGIIHGFLGFRRAIPSAQSDMVTVLQIALAMICESTA